MLLINHFWSFQGLVPLFQEKVPPVHVCWHPQWLVLNNEIVEEQKRKKRKEEWSDRRSSSRRRRPVSRDRRRRRRRSEVADQRACRSAVATADASRRQHVASFRNTRQCVTLITLSITVMWCSAGPQLLYNTQVPRHLTSSIGIEISVVFNWNVVYFYPIWRHRVSGTYSMTAWALIIHTEFHVARFQVVENDLISHATS